jgi:tetratricopeptide (TPR) repeat protein
MYQQIKNYEMAAICLEKAIVQDKYNARIYYYLSFLHPSRYEERGFSTRDQILLMAVKLDPGYWQAVYEYANELYLSGTAAATNPKTIKAIKFLQDFNNLNPNNEKILALLGRFLLQSKYTREAVQIFEKLVVLSENSAIYHYNLGICYFHLKKYDKAMDFFNQAIHINDYPDAYLYIGAIHRLAGDRDKALYYYRERVKRQIGDDDMYAREAMQGIRIILNEIAEEEEQESQNAPAPVKN